MSRQPASKTYSYPLRYRWAYLPTLGFLVVITVILLADPSLIWANPDQATLRLATLLAASITVGFAVAIGARWAAPVSFSVESDALVARPLLGSARRVPYAEITDVRVLRKTFLRGVPEVVLHVERGRPIAIRTDIDHFEQLQRALGRHLPPALQARWKEARAT